MSKSECCGAVVERVIEKMDITSFSLVAPGVIVPVGTIKEEHYECSECNQPCVPK